MTPPYICVKRFALALIAAAALGHGLHRPSKHRPPKQGRRTNAPAPESLGAVHGRRFVRAVPHEGQRF